MKSTINRSLLRTEYINSTRKGGTFWRPDTGTTRIRVLEGWPGAVLPFVTLAQHFLGGEEQKSYACPATPGIKDADGKDRTCIICKASRHYKRLGSEIEEQLGNDLSPRKVFLWNVLVRGKESEGIKIYSAGWTVHSTLLAYVADEENPNFLDPFKGFDVVIERIGSGLKTKYNIRAVTAPCSLARTKEETETLWNSATDLTKHLVAPSEEELKAALSRMQGNPEEFAFLGGSSGSKSGSSASHSAASPDEYVVAADVEEEDVLPPPSSAPTSSVAVEEAEPIKTSFTSVGSAPGGTKMVSQPETPTVAATPPVKMDIKSLKARLAQKMKTGVPVEATE
jgi:hypothetical protein